MSRVAPPTKAVSGQTLIGMLAAIAIILILATIFLWPGGKDGDKGKGKSMPAQVKERAESVECQSNVRQIRMGVQMNTMAGEPAPKSLAELKYPAEVLQCPVGHQPYKYDPQTGQVQCVYPGHEKY